jgi:hypothetical protein
MGNKTKSFASAVALGFALLFFGPATSKAQADHFGPHVSFQGHFPLPHGSINVHAGNGRYFRHHSYYPRHRYARPQYGYGHSYFRSQRPYRLVRVFVYAPYPRWVYRRVYSTSYSTGGAYRPY